MGVYEAISENFLIGNNLFLRIKMVIPLTSIMKTLEIHQKVERARMKR